MPKEKEVTNHPCHLLSLPSAKRFWCRHCMTVFEDAITRWRHSRSCRYGVVNNFMRRRELEAKALQNTTVLNPVEARLEQSIQMCDLASSSVPPEPDPNIQPQTVSGPETFTCFICHQKFATMEEMRAHVKDPCSNSKIITSHVPHPKHSVPVFIDALPGRTRAWQSTTPAQQSQDEVHPPSVYGQVHNQNQQVQANYDIEVQSQSNIETQYDSTSVSYENSGNTTSDSITPTNIYVNEQGETVIEVENLDLNTEGGELSLAHLLTQLSQQGIVFDKTGSAHLQPRPDVAVSGASTSTTLYATHPDYEQSPGEFSKVKDEEEQPTAEDAANTLAQLAGFRGFTRMNQKTQEDEQQVQPQIEGYTYQAPSPGPSRQYMVNAQPRIDVAYDFQYTDNPAETGHTLVTAPQIALQQPMTISAQDYENIKIETEETNAPVQFYNDSSYIADNRGHQQIHVDTSTNQNIEEMKTENVHDVDNQSVMVQHYSVQVDGTGQLVNVPVELPGQVVSDASDNVDAVMNTEHAGIGEVAEAAAAITQSEGGPPEPGSRSKEAEPVTSHDVQSEGLVTGDLAQNQETDVHADPDEFTIQTVSLQEIVDPETSALSFGGQAQTQGVVNNNIMSSSIASSGSGELTSVTLRTADQPAVELMQPAVTQEDGQPLPNEPQPSLATAATALFVVSSTGIVPVSRENAG